MHTREFEIVERGTGSPLVLIPGIQGRWEYSRATVEALARFCRVITFSLGDERTGSGTSGPMDVFADQVESVLDRVGLDAAAIAGVSFGGLVALRFAATRPGRAAALVMMSPPGPRWHLRRRHDLYARWPWVFGPAFLAEVPGRLRDEVRAAFPDRRQRRAFTLRQLRAVVMAPVSLARLAARARLIGGYDRVADCRLVTAPTLIMHGEPRLDHVTGDGGTEDYSTLIAGAQRAQLDCTGHLGSVTRADICARIIQTFLDTTTKDRHHSAA